MVKIIIVEDELIVARDLRRTLERNGYKISAVVTSVEKAIQAIGETKPSLVLVDIFLKGPLTGIDLATYLNQVSIPFIYVSANSNQLVLEAAKSTNPYGFIVKPFRERDLLVTIDIARYRFANDRQINDVAAITDMKPGSQESESNKEQAKSRLLTIENSCTGLIGKSNAMVHVFNLIQKVAPFDSSVLILGESGTGKEVVADCICNLSKRSAKPFIRINCAAIPSGLLEAELFGYEKGAFTGAAGRRAGKFELASGGTILLDEIGEMPVEMQVKLLRVLQEKEIQRIGAAAPVKVDVRVLAATSRNLEKEVAEGRFRLDLYYRLHVFPITLPPLRERKEDIQLLADHYIGYYAAKAGKRITGLSSNAIRQLFSYNWPGNVRELQYLIERTVLLTDGDRIDAIEFDIVTGSVSNKSQKEKEVTDAGEMEKNRLLAALEQCDFRIAGKGGAAELLDMPATTLHSKMKKWGITRTHR